MIQTAFGTAGTGFLVYITAIQNRFTLGSAHAAKRLPLHPMQIWTSYTILARRPM